MEIDPKNLVPLVLTGSGDMGDVTDRVSRCRFKLADDPFFLAYFLCAFSDGSGVAVLQIRRDHRISDLLDFVEWEPREPVGGGAIVTRIDWRAPLEERLRYTYQPRDLSWPHPGDELVVTWTDPDPGKATVWAIEVGLVRMVEKKPDVVGPTFDDEGRIIGP